MNLRCQQTMRPLFPDQTDGEVGDEHPEPEQPEVPEVTADQMQLLLQKDPKFADTALKMAMFPTTIDWNHPDVIHVEKTLIFELKYFKKMRNRAPRAQAKAGQRHGGANRGGRAASGGALEEVAK